MNKNKIHNIKEAGFKVPNNYFNNFEDVVMNQIKLTEKVSHSGFKTPYGYFDTLEDRIIEKTSEQNSSKVISLFNKRTLIYISGVAAAVLLLFNLSIFERDPWSSLDTETVENYLLDENILDSYELASLMTEEELAESDFTDVNFDDENIETYLLNHLDVEDLIAE
ncbi:hypothetical protein WJN01_12970 [Flavobacteriaceae bacterium SZ-1-7]|uniref:hypothetical protein n=1 Tax=Tamlana sedimenti TaxID=3134126 RepID=UPI003129A9B0